MHQEQQQETDRLLAATATVSLEQEATVDPPQLSDHRPATPLWAWCLLYAAVSAHGGYHPAAPKCRLPRAACASPVNPALPCLHTCQVTAVSSAGVVFAKLVEVPPITLAAWRLQLTSVFLGVGAAVQLSRMPPAARARTLQQVRRRRGPAGAGAAIWRASSGALSGDVRRPSAGTSQLLLLLLLLLSHPTLQVGLLVVSGTCLCFHFGAWVFSVEATSLTHSLLFVSATPLFLAAGTWLLRKPISAGELAGTAAGLAGGVLLATAAARSDAQVTVRGDLAALSASLAFVGYLLIGQRLRTWMPLFVYAFRWVGGWGGWEGWAGWQGVTVARVTRDSVPCFLCNLFMRCSSLPVCCLPKCFAHPHAPCRLQRHRAGCSAADPGQPRV